MDCQSARHRKKFLKPLLTILISMFPVFGADRLERLEGWMKESKRWQDEMSLEAVAGSQRFVMIKRGGKIVGYYYEDYQWEPMDLSKVDLAGVTKITYGQELRGEKDPFTISEPSEILLWVAAYKNHTEHQRGHTMFVPLGEDAGFQHSREEIDYGGVFMNHMGVRFYVGDKQVLTVKGHFEKDSMIDMRERNEALHILVKAKFTKEVKKPKAVADAKEIDPFADESDSGE